VAASEAALSPRQGTLLSIAVLLPTLALLGYY
jgi:adenylate cyclase